MKRALHPMRAVVAWSFCVGPYGGKFWNLRLACGHTITRKAVSPMVKPQRARCGGTGCL